MLCRHVLCLLHTVQVWSIVYFRWGHAKCLSIDKRTSPHFLFYNNSSLEVEREQKFAFMKRIYLLSFLSIFLLFGDCFAQTYKYYSTDFACKAKNEYGYWTEWSDWEASHCLVTISLDRNVVNIYSPIPQEFDIYDNLGESYDSDGQSLTLCGVDTDGLRCHIRLRKQNNGVLQLYIEYNDVILVYCLTERN